MNQIQPMEEGLTNTKHQMTLSDALKELMSLSPPLFLDPFDFMDESPPLILDSLDYMDEWYVSSLLQRLDSIIRTEVLEMIRSRKRQPMERIMIEEKLRAGLNITLSSILDVEGRQSTNEYQKKRLGNIADVAYAIEDFLDDWRAKIIESRKYRIKEVCSLFSFRACYHRNRKVDRIRKSLKSLETELYKSYLLTENFNQRLRKFASPPENNCTVTTTTNYDDDYEDMSNVGVLGRDSDKEIIVNKLIRNGNTDRETGTGLTVLPIVGMGGIGKTTLAEQVFNADQVIPHFDMRIWVSVAKNSDHQTLLRQIIEAVTRTNDDDDDDNGLGVVSGDDLLHLLSKCVKRKKFLLVLDGVWDEDIQNWQGLKHSLESGAQGSSVLVTTQNKMAAYLMSTTDLHHLGKLSDEDSWSLFHRIALKGRNSNSEDELKTLTDIGRKLVKLCHGHPLAVKVLAGLMRVKRTRQEWIDVMESDEWEQLETETILPPLQFAYYSLPSHLKQCFTYTSIFPEDHKIKKDVLIKLWMAQGFLGSSELIDMEMIGEEYFQNLVRRSFLQVLKKDKDGKATHCKVHGLLRDLNDPISLYLESCKADLISSKVRHLSISNMNSDSVLPYKNLRKLHTLKLFKCRLSPSIVSPNVFKSLKFLRALDFSFSDFEKLPNEIGRLTHLKHLDLSRTNLKCLPETLCNLYNLQTLRLNGCKRLSKLPKGMKKLINLRHLEILCTPELHYLPQGIGRLSSLRTLSKFFASASKGECKIGELKDLLKLQGNIYIGGLCTVESLAEANEAGLKNMEYLRHLILDFSPYDLENAEVNARKMESVLEGLQPHPKLEKLAIHHGHVSKLPSWMVSHSTLSNLRTLTLNDCQELEKLPALGKLPSLQELYIQNLDGVKQIGNEFYGIGSGAGVKIAFQVLEELHVVDMANLEQWDFIIHDEKIMPRLRDLSLQDCPKLTSVPHIFPNTLMNLHVSGCPKLPSSAFRKSNLQCLPRSPMEKNSPKQTFPLSSEELATT